MNIVEQFEFIYLLGVPKALETRRFSTYRGGFVSLWPSTVGTPLMPILALINSLHTAQIFCLPAVFSLPTARIFYLKNIISLLLVITKQYFALL